MTQCFERYETEKRVFSVSGYSWPIELGDAESDIYFCGRTSSWGWGTWRDRWCQYEKDYSLYKKLKMDRESSERLATWGNDIEQTVIGNVTGMTDSWGLFWVMKAIEKNALCINPYKSLIRNIGMDGSGVHCGITDSYDVEQDNLVKDSYKLVDKIELTEEVKKAFAGLFGSYTAVTSYSEDKEKIIVYGLGNFFISNEKSINENYFIECFIDNSKTGYYAGKRIFKAKEIGKISDISKILIMIQDINECMKVCRELVSKYRVAIEKIELGCQYYGKYQNVIKNVFVKEDGRWEITFGGDAAHIKC